MLISKSNLKYFIIGIGFFCGLSLGAAYADSVTILETSFPVNKVTPLDSSALKLDLQDFSQVISKDQLESVIVNYYFEQHPEQLSFGPEPLQKFIRNAILADRPNWAALAMRHYGRISGQDPKSATDFIEELAKLRGIGQTFQFYFEQVGELTFDSERNALLLFFAGQNNLDWLRTAGVRYVYQLGGELRALQRLKMFQALVSRDFDAAGKIVDFYGATFGIDDAEFIELRSLLSKVRQALLEADAGDVSRLYPLLNLQQSNEQLGNLLTPIVIELLHKETAKVLGAAKFEQALIMLSHIDIKRRTPTTHDLIRQALAGLEPSTTPVTSDPEVRAMLRSFSIHDELLRRLYIDYLDRQADFSLSHNDQASVNEILDQLVFIRPDPNKRNDLIRLNQTLHLIRAGEDEKAREKLAQTVTAMPFLYRLRLAWAKLSVDFSLALLILLIPIIISVLLYFRFRSVRGVSNSGAPDFVIEEASPKFESAHSFEHTSAQSGEVAAEPEEKPAFVFAGMQRAMSPQVQEYNRCLAVFGLVPGADLRTIKAAYRSAVKEVHPDINSNLDSKAHERFVELTRAYDMLLQLKDQIDATST